MAKKVTKEKVIYLLREGYRKMDIADMLGISRATLWRRMKEWGLLANHTENTDPGSIRHMREIGMSWEAVAEALGVNRRTVFRLRRQLEAETGQEIK